LFNFTDSFDESFKQSIIEKKDVSSYKININGSALGNFNYPFINNRFEKFKKISKFDIFIKFENKNFEVIKIENLKISFPVNNNFFIEKQKILQLILIF
jgi:hypothetical protein